MLDPGEKQDVRFTLGERAFSQWDAAAGGWAVVPGPHELAIGSSSRDLHLTATLPELVAPAE